MIPDEERHKMMKASSIGPTMVRYLDMIGIERLADLKDLSAEELQMRINDMLGRRHINETGRRALENLIELALSED